MKVTVFGLGYVGSVTAAALARDGHEVVGVDVSVPKIEALNAGRAPVLEPGVDAIVAEAVSAGRLRATDDPADGLSDADVSLICVGTPSRSDGSLDLQYVVQVAGQIGSKLSLAADDEVDLDYRKFIGILKEELAKNPTQAESVISWLLAAKSIERVADLATNIAEDTIYTVEGTIVRHSRA